MTLCWRGAEEFEGDFFSLRFFGGCPWAGRPGPALGPHSRAVDDDLRPPEAPWGTSLDHHGGKARAPAPPQTNQTSNQTSGGSLVSWPRLPRFGSFPFRFPFRGEKGSAPLGWGRAASAHIGMSPKVQLEIHLGGSGT